LKIGIDIQVLEEPRKLSCVLGQGTERDNSTLELLDW